MSTILGKRKRRESQREDLASQPSTNTQALYQDALRKHFEANFESIESPNHNSFILPLSGQDDSEPHTPNTDAESEWEGLSDTENIETVSYVSATTIHDDYGTARSLRKRFMGSKPPQEDSKLPTSQNKSANGEKISSRNVSNLTAEDIALQRLLAESHLLRGTAGSIQPPTLKTRHATQDLRLQTLGAKQAVNAIGAGNTPMALRKGIENKKRMKEQGRRREAKESGVILEKEVETSFKNKRRKRSRDVGAPAVGKWRGGTLVLGKKDVAEIEGQKFTNAYSNKRKGKSKGRKR
ncbi:MAG: hypothetical protein GOMPHAMPRED_007594 [Gomphillus americanus]|uniref:Uncharacterized protein n=1 Tax=Gomphillus americanus TaxID=1940652 RepID=A0A8H3IDR6_9LECA|nr:MAG: hypothetical protein GOMPHAMPRED_007594 [Gomphillus americanus]